MRRVFSVGWLACALALVPLAKLSAQGQRLTLQEALHRADQSAYANRIANGSVRVRAADRTAALAGFLPSVHAEAGYLRSTEPLTAFGLLLKQRGVTQAAFDPTRLNSPAAIDNYGGGLVLEQPLINVDAWLGRSAAARAAGAEDASRDWTRNSVQVDVVRAYYGAVLADLQVRTLEAALLAAQEHARQAESMAQNGLVTRSDVLQAQVRAGDVQASLIAGRSGARLARRQLAVLLGAPDDTLFGLPPDLPSIEHLRALAQPLDDSSAVRDRSDVRAAELGAGAASRNLARARAAYLPRVNSFARYDWNATGGLFQGSRSWTVGVMASWSPWSGGRQLSELERAGGQLDVARAQAEAARAQAELELTQRRSGLTVALARLEIAHKAVGQSAEAARIVARKYAGGLATVVELLGADAANTEQQLRLADARYQVLVAIVALRQAEGRPDPALTVIPE